MQGPVTISTKCSLFLRSSIPPQAPTGSAAEKIKEDIDFLMKMQPKKYKLKNMDTDCCQFGLIAQEVLAECKTMHQKLIVHNADEYLADSNTDKMLGLSYESFIPLLIKCVQDQEKKSRRGRQ